MPQSMLPPMEQLRALHSSPLAIVVRYLSVLSWFGFPLRQDCRAKETTFVISVWDYIKMAVTFCIACVPFFIQNFIISGSLYNFSKFIMVMDKIGFTMLDIVTVVAVIFVGLFNNFGGFIRIGRRRIEFTRLFRNFESTCASMDAYFKDVVDSSKERLRISDLSMTSYRMGFWAAVVSVTLTLTASVLSAATMYVMFTTQVHDPSPNLTLVWIVVLLLPFASCVAIFGGAIAGADMIILFFPHFAAGMLQCYVERLSAMGTTDHEASKRGDSSQISTLSNTSQESSSGRRKAMAFNNYLEAASSSNTQKCDDYFSLGLRLCDLVREMNAQFDILYVGQFSMSILLCVLTLYASTTIFFIEHPQTIHYLNAATYLTFGVLFIFRLTVSCYFGQVLDDACKNTRMDLDDFISRHLDDLGKHEMYRGRMLMDRLDKVTPLQPWGYFPVNQSTLVAAGSVVLTYLIILVQFKDSSKTGTECVHAANASSCD